MNWSDEYESQNDYLAAQLRALSRKPYRIRKKFVDRSIRCSGCGDLVAEVVKLDPYRVIHYRGPDGLRLDDWQFAAVADDDLGEDDEWLIAAACRCSQHELTARYLLTVKGSDTSRPTRPT